MGTKQKQKIYPNILPPIADADPVRIRVSWWPGICVRAGLGSRLVWREPDLEAERDGFFL